MNLTCAQLVKFFSPVFEPFYQSQTRKNRVHGVQFYPFDGSPTKVFILCTATNKVLMSTVDAQGNCSQTSVELDGSNNLGFPIGMKPSSNNITLQGVKRVCAPVTVFRFRLCHRRIMGDQAHFDRNLSRRCIGIGTNQEKSTCRSKQIIIDTF